MVRLTRRLFPVTAHFHGEHFLVRAGSPASRESEVPGAVAVADPVVEAARPGTLLLTPLALALIMVETTDLIFAVDSIRPLANRTWLKTLRTLEDHRKERKYLGTLRTGRGD